MKRMYTICLLYTSLPRFQQLAHLFADVHPPVAACGFRLLGEDLLSAELDHRPLHMDGPVPPVNVRPA